MSVVARAVARLGRIAGRSLPARHRFRAKTLALQISNALESAQVLPSVSRRLDTLCIPRPEDRLTPSDIDDIRSRHPGYGDIAVFIETGTLEAANVVNLAPAFREAHSIDLSRTLFRAAVKRFGPHTRFGINFHLGDSAEVLPALLEAIHEPAVVYLDGHYCKWDTDFTAASTFPLWSELSALARRPYREIVIVDDVHTFSTDRPDLKVRESGRGWEAVTTDSIIEALGRERVVDSYIHRDCFVVFLAEPESAP